MTTTCEPSSYNTSDVLVQLEHRIRQKSKEFQSEIDIKFAELNSSIYLIQSTVQQFVQKLFSDLQANVKLEHQYHVDPIESVDTLSRRESTSSLCDEISPLFVSIKMEPVQTLDPKASIATSAKKGIFCCPQCRKILKTSRALTLHMSRVHDIVLPRKNYPQSNNKTEKSFMCDICPAMFREINMFKAHRRTHTGENWFECDICGKKTSLKARLVMHMRRHSGERPFRCDVCSKTFQFPGSFRSHKQLHEAIVPRPYKCITCEKAFRFKAHLTSHILSHTGERPHLCPICKRGYTKRCHVKNHLRKHHQIADCDAVYPGKTRRTNLVIPMSHL